MKLTHTSTYRVRSYEVDQDNRASLIALCNMLQDAASMHAAELGFGYEDLHRLGRAWVLSRAYLHMETMPGFGEDVTVETWPSGNQRTVATRDFLLMRSGVTIGRATSAWAVIDIESRRAVSPEDLIAERDIPKRDKAVDFEGRAVKRIKEGPWDAAVHARFGDHDLNGHVNSMRSVEYCLESMPRELSTDCCVAADIQFRAECFGGDELRSVAAPQEDGTVLHSLVRQSDERETARMKTWWAK
ncbi:acyl-[acyl-carrier-protein] thioesterase [Salidesulfovibrio brasiliensis]|uniref:acyl-[acyl-carrier-protein] thioesterase n=1 Tax=Salidesulfovibrio brasiliensis TaxID=221711 RepID=UPI0006D24D3D|nr:acyl-ACP thioesterase domain-containing protein [Salidesulfovibrio brasiliensis]